MKNEKIKFITGASKSFGLMLVNPFLSNGNIVTATSRNIMDLQKNAACYQDNFLPFQIDIINEHSVKSALRQCVERFGRFKHVTP
jgi:NADP-dependent 3-hydroxy acid dehydrogenase YdfG